MITRFPILEYLSKQVGEYPIEGKPLSIHLKRAGYGFLLQVDEPPPRSAFYGLIGVSGTELELHSNIGSPNVVIFKWLHNFAEISHSNLKIEFAQPELALSLILEFSNDWLQVSFVTNGRVVSSFMGKRPNNSFKADGVPPR